MSQCFPAVRLRRLRNHPRIRDLIRETCLSINDVVFPLFIRHGENIKSPIASMPGQFQLSVDQLAPEIEEISRLGIPAVLLFGIPQEKNAIGSDSWHDAGVIQQASRCIKELNPNLLVIADCCFCEYTDHGHCGAITRHEHGWHLENDKTLELLTKQAISMAQNGADIVAPSSNTDGMVQAIRQGLDAASLTNTAILSYSAKFASSLYGPFREAAEGAPKFGDRKTYQMDPANGDEAVRESELDILEGADMLMVKPAGTYLDIIYRTKQQFPGLPLAAYQVSGEYAMIKAAAQNGWLNEKQVILESLLAIKRAGATFIITYFAKDLARYLGSAANST